MFILNLFSKRKGYRENVMHLTFPSRPSKEDIEGLIKALEKLDVPVCDHELKTSSALVLENYKKGKGKLA